MFNLFDKYLHYYNYRNIKKRFKNFNFNDFYSSLNDIDVTSSKYYLFKKDLFLNKHLETVLYQSIIVKLCNRIRLSKFFHLCSFFNFKVILPLPKNYLFYLRSNNLKINFFLSSLLYSLYCFLYSLKSFKILFKIIFTSNHFNKNYILIPNYFSDKSILKHDVRLYNLLNWIISYFNLNGEYIYSKSFELNNISYNNNNLVKINNYYLKLSFYSKITIILWFIKYYLLSFFLFLFNKPNNLLIFEEILFYKHIKLADPNFYPSSVIFTSADQNLRPLWTYYLETFNFSKIFYLNYSGSLFGYDKIIKPAIGFKHQSWSNRFEISKNFILFAKNNLIKQPNFFYTSRIYMTDSLELFNDSNKILVIFDHMVYSKFTKSVLLDFNKYFDSTTSIKFIQDIVNVAIPLNYTIVLKCKKAKHDDINYPKHLLNLQSKFPNKFIVTNTASPYRLIENSHISISFPFSTTGVIAKNLSKKTCYYDPLNTLKDISIQKQNIKTLYSSDDLHEFLI